VWEEAAGSGTIDRTMVENALSASWLANRLGTQSTRIDAMRRSRELFAVRRPGSQEYLYPAWQFDDAGRPLPVVQRLLHVAKRAGLDDDALARLLNRRAGLVGGKRLVDILREGGEEHVLQVVAEAGRG
jgi:hypothetical protein